MSKNKKFQQITALNTIHIEQSGNERHLKFDNDLDAIQSAIDLQQPHRLIMLNLRYLMGILLFIKVPEKILLLGAGGGSLIHYLAHYLPESQVTAVEYNAELLEIAQQHLNLPGTSARLNYVIDDAREFIQATTEKYDLVIIDIFEGGQSPLWSLQKPFNQQLQHCLTQQGAVAYNLLINSEPKFSRFYQLIRQLYAQQSLCLETEDYENILVYALNHNTGSLTMEQQMLRCEQLSQRYELPFRQILKAIYTINPLGSGII